MQRLRRGVVADVGGDDAGHQPLVEARHVGAVLQIAARHHDLEEVALRTGGHRGHPFGQGGAVL